MMTRKLGVGRVMQGVTFKFRGVLPLRRRVLMLMPVWLAALLLFGCSDAPSQGWQIAERGGLMSASLDGEAGRVLAGSVGHGGSLWRLSDGARLYDWNHVDDDHSLLVATAFSPDGSLAATAERNSIAVWRTDTGQALGMWRTEAGVRSLALSGDGRWLLAGLFDGVAMLIDLRLRQPAGRIQHRFVVNTVALDGAGRLAVTGSDDGAVQVWNIADGSERLAWRYPSGVSTVALSADGRLVYAGRQHGKGEIRDVDSGQVLSQIGHDRSTIVSARFSADGRRLLTGLPAGELILWDVASGAQLARWQAPRGQLWYPTARVPLDVALDERSGRVVAVFSDGAVLAWPL